MTPGTKVTQGVVVDWKKYPNVIKTLAVDGISFNHRTQCLVKTDHGYLVIDKTDLREVKLGKEVHKILAGHVIQRWDKATGQFLGQKFIGGNTVYYQDELGNPIEQPPFELKLP